MTQKLSDIEKAVRREAQKRFGREWGRMGVQNISQFALDMIRLAREHADVVARIAPADEPMFTALEAGREQGAK